MKKKHILSIVAVVILVAAMAVAYSVFSEKPVEGQKEITIEVVNSKKESTVYEVNTDAEYLYEAMLEADGLEFDGEETEFGFTVSEVNGEKTADNLVGAYWAFYVGEEYCSYGVSQQPVEDGDAFRIVYTPAS